VGRQHRTLVVGWQRLFQLATFRVGRSGSDVPPKMPSALVLIEGELETLRVHLALGAHCPRWA
jgi:hypothetical protein